MNLAHRQNDLMADRARPATFPTLHSPRNKVKHSCSGPTEEHKFSIHSVRYQSAAVRHHTCWRKKIASFIVYIQCTTSPPFPLKSPVLNLPIFQYVIPKFPTLHIYSLLPPQDLILHLYTAQPSSVEVPNTNDVHTQLPLLHLLSRPLPRLPAPLHHVPRRDQHSVDSRCSKAVR